LLLTSQGGEVALVAGEVSISEGALH